MTPQAKLTLVSAALAATLGLAAGPVAAVQRGDVLVRVGVAHVAPDADSDPVPGFGAASKVDVDSASSLGLNFTYMVTDNIGVQALAAWPFKHDIEGAGSIAGAGKVAETKHLPPTVTVQWHFTPQRSIRPFVGAGINYTNFFSEKTMGAIAGTSLKLDDSWGLAAEAGIDVDLNRTWFVSGQVWYMDIDTEATVNGTASFDVNIDPWVFMVGVGTKF